MMKGMKQSKRSAAKVIPLLMKSIATSRFQSRPAKLPENLCWTSSRRLCFGVGPPSTEGLTSVSLTTEPTVTLD